MSGTSLTVSGTLINDVDSLPIAGAFVVIESRTARAGEAKGAKTGSDGRFVIENITADEYEITVEKQNFVRLSRTIRHGDGPLAREGSTATTDRLELRMLPQAAVAGRVTDSGGQPLVGAVVQISRVYLQGRITLLSPIAQAATNDLGDYRVFGLEPGRYYVGASYQDQGSRMGLRSLPSPDAAEGSEPATEEYAVTYYPSGTTPGEATPVRLRAGQSMEKVDIRLSMTRSFTVSGEIRNLAPNAPAPRVFLQPWQPGTLGPVRFDVPASGSATFRFKSIAPGTYVVRAESSFQGAVLSAREQVVVTSSSVNRVLMDLQPAFAIKGTAKMEDDGGLPSDAQIRLSGLDRRFVIPISPDGNGNFEVPVPGPDNYAVDVISQSGAAFLKSAELDYHPIGVNGVSVHGPNHLLNLVISRKAGAITGLVADSDRRPAAKGLVLLVASNPGDSRSYGVPVRADGTYELKSLPPGDYRIICFSDLSAPWDATWDIQTKVRTAGKEVTIRGGEILNISLDVNLADPS